MFPDWLSLSKAATSCALNWSELALLVFGVVLVYGLVGEYKTLEQHRQRMKLFEMLVIVGVAGELISDGGIFLFSSHLQTIADTEIARVNMESAKLRMRAAQLEASVARRKLSKAQQLMFADDLKRFAGTKVVLSYLAGDPEAQLFAEDIAAALRAAKCKVPPIEPFILFGRWGGGAYPLHPLTGVNLVITKNRSSQDAHDAIQRELCSLGFDTTFISKVEPEVDVLVVARPNSPQGLAKLAIDAKTLMKTCTATSP
jgi:hypothetical protein